MAGRQVGSPGLPSLPKPPLVIGRRPGKSTLALMVLEAAIHTFIMGTIHYQICNHQNYVIVVSFGRHAVEGVTLRSRVFLQPDR
jgi:hypothetical protein